MDIPMLYDTSFETFTQTPALYKSHSDQYYANPVASTPFFLDNQPYETLIEVDRTIQVATATTPLNAIASNELQQPKYVIVSNSTAVISTTAPALTNFPLVKPTSRMISNTTISVMPAMSIVPTRSMEEQANSAYSLTKQGYLKNLKVTFVFASLCLLLI